MAAYRLTRFVCSEPHLEDGSAAARDWLRTEATLAAAVEQIVTAIRQRLPGCGHPLLVAVDGGSGAGKSTLAAIVAREVAATVVEGDDFFSAERTELEWEALTPAERAAAAIDWQRMRREAIEPLLAGKIATWHPFNFAAMQGLAPHTVTARPARVIILDGIYSSRPELSDLIDLSVLVDAPAAARYRRHDDRERGNEAVWHARWDPAENCYFTHVRPAGAFDVVVNTHVADVETTPPPDRSL